VWLQAGAGGVEACFEDTSFTADTTSIGDALASQLNLKQRIKLTKTESRETHKQTISGGTALKHTHTHTHTHEATSEVPWVRAPSLLPPAEIARLFNRIEPDDILQGALGDCWLLAAIAAIAEFPQYIEEELFVTKVLDGDDQPGKYRLRLYDAAASAWEEVTIDDRIPCDPKKAWFDAPTPLFAKNYGAEVYVMLIEKAFAKFAGSLRGVPRQL